MRELTVTESATALALVVLTGCTKEAAVSLIDTFESLERVDAAIELVASGIDMGTVVAMMRLDPNDYLLIPAVRQLLVMGLEDGSAEDVGRKLAAMMG